MADRPGATVNVLLDRDDNIAVTRQLLARHDPAAGRIVVHPTPGHRSAGALAHDLLAALGAPTTAATETGLGYAPGAWSAARAWITVDRPGQLVVLRAHLLPPAAWTAVAAVASSSGLILLLVCHLPAVPTRLIRALGPSPHRVLSSLPAALSAIGWDRPGQRRPQPADRRFPRLPRLPTGGMLHYRADVFRQQPRPVFVQVDALYGRGLDAACRWLRRHPRLPDDGGYAAEASQRFLTRLVYDSPTPRHAIAQIRGAQAGFLLHGYWLKHPSAATLRGPAMSGTPITTAVVNKVRAQVAHPIVAAGIAISMLTGLPVASLRGLSGDAVRSAVRYLTISVRVNVHGHAAIGKTYAPSWNRDIAFYIPPVAQCLLRAARAYLTDRRLDPFVFDTVATNPERVAQAADRCGLQLPSEPMQLTTCWHLLTERTRIGDPVHASHHRQRPLQDAGQSCLTAVSVTDAAVAEPPHRKPHDLLASRWPSDAAPPVAVAELLRAYLAEDEPHLDPPPAPQPGMPPPLPDWLRRYSLVERHLAVRLPPTTEHRDRITLHSDIAFALRLTDRPASGISTN